MGTNNHGVHANRYLVNLEEVCDVPENIIFKADPNVRFGVHGIVIDGLSEEENKKIIKEIYNGFQITKHGLFTSIIMDRDTAFKFMKYKKNYRIFSFKVYNFDEFLKFEEESVKSRINNKEQEEILNNILELDNISDSHIILGRILMLEDSQFKKKALLLLKIKAFDIEDKHFLSEKGHRKEDLEDLKLFRKTNYKQ